MHEVSPAYGLWGLVLINSLIFTLVMFPILVWFYGRLAHREDAAAAGEFGEEWKAYARATPAFFPRFGMREAGTA